MRVCTWTKDDPTSFVRKYVSSFCGSIIPVTPYPAPISAAADMKNRALRTPFFSTTGSSFFFPLHRITHSFTLVAVSQHLAFTDAPALDTRCSGDGFTSSTGFFAPIIVSLALVRSLAK